jgi:hypothetical protein
MDLDCSTLTGLVLRLALSSLQISNATAAGLAEKVLGQTVTERFKGNDNSTGVYTRQNIPQVIIKEQLLWATAHNQGWNASSSTRRASQALHNCYGAKAYGRSTQQPMNVWSKDSISDMEWGIQKKLKREGGLHTGVFVCFDLAP